MVMPPFFLFGFGLTLLFYGVLFVAGIVFIRRTWQQIKGEQGSPIGDRVLNELDRMQIQLQITNERLDKMERSMDVLSRGALEAARLMGPREEKGEGR